MFALKYLCVNHCCDAFSSTTPPLTAISPLSSHPRRARSAVIGTWILIYSMGQFLPCQPFHQRSLICACTAPLRSFARHPLLRNAACSHHSIHPRLHLALFLPSRLQDLEPQRADGLNSDGDWAPVETLLAVRAPQPLCCPTPSPPRRCTLTATSSALVSTTALSLDALAPRRYVGSWAITCTRGQFRQKSDS